MKRNNKKGFTIVELVIVIAVIAILATVLIPTFSGLINKANESANLQKARNAFSQYLANVDYAGGNAPTDVYVEVEEGKYYKVDSDGKVDTTVVTALPAGATVIDADGSVIDAVVATATKLGYKDDDPSLVNQDKINVTTSGNVITIDILEGQTLQDVTSSNQAQGTHKWVALVINTGVDDITTIKYEGEFLTAADVAEATERGAGKGCFILWVYEGEGGRTSFTLGATTYRIEWK